MESIENIQAHKFEPIKKYFEKSSLSFKSEYELVNSLKKSDNHRLILKDAEDQKFRRGFLKIIKIKFDNPETLKQLWDVCRIPDYQNISDEKHVELLTKIFNELKKSMGIF